MRILTVRQPWAWAIIHGGKDVENRQRNVAGNYRGPVAIHAGLASFEDDGQYWEIRRAITTETNGWPASDSEVWSSDLVDPADDRFVFGAIIGVVDLVDVHSRVHSRTGHPQCNLEGLCSPWAETHALHLVLANPRSLTAPMPYRGMLGLRTLDDETTAQILAAIA